MQIRTRVRNGRGEGNLVGNRAMVFLTLLRTQLILEENAIDAFQSNGNVPLANVAPLRNDFRCKSSGLGFVFRRWQDSARKTLICVRIWRNMSRAASLMLSGLCGCFIELCAVAYTDCCYFDACLVSMRYSCLTAKLLAISLRPNTWIRLEGSKKCGDLAAYTMNLWWHAIPCDHCPSVSRDIIVSRALNREKWDFPCFPNFIQTNFKCGRTYFTIDAERISTVAR